MFVDQFAGTTPCLVLLGLRIGILRGDRAVIGESGLFAHFIRPELDRIAAEGYSRFGRIVGVANDEQFAARVTELREQFTEAAHLTEGAEQRELAAAPLDPIKVDELLGRLGAGVDTQGIRLMSRLRELNLVAFSNDEMPDAKTFRWVLPYPKQGLVAESPAVVVVGGVTPLNEVEDDWLLRIIFQNNRRIRQADGLDEAAVVLDQTIERLTDAGLPPTLIVLPWDWELTAHLLRRDGQDPQLAPEGNAIGAYRGIELIRGLQWQSRDLVFVLSVPHLAQIALRHPVPTVLSERFHVEVRPPNDTELEDDLRKPAPTSSVGLPFAGPDLIAYRRNELRVEVTEYMRLDIVNRAAARAIRIRR
jgi:hypothetical protein